MPYDEYDSYNLISDLEEERRRREAAVLGPDAARRLNDLRERDRERAQMMDETRGIRWAIDNMGGSTTRRNALKIGALQDWTARRAGTDARGMEELRGQNAVNIEEAKAKGLLDVANAKAEAERAAAATGLEGVKYKSDQELAAAKAKADAERAVAATGLEGTKYKADKEAEGAKYGADKGVEAAKYKADKDAEAAKDKAAAELGAAKAAAAAKAASAAALADGGFTLKDYAEIYSKISAGQLPDSFAYMPKEVQAQMLESARSTGGFDQWLAGMGLSRGPDGAVVRAPAQPAPAPAGGRRRFNPNE